MLHDNSQVMNNTKGQVFSQVFLKRWSLRFWWLEKTCFLCLTQLQGWDSKWGALGSNSFRLGIVQEHHSLERIWTHCTYALVVPHWVVLNWETSWHLFFPDNFWENPKELGCFLKVIVQLFLGFMKGRPFRWHQAQLPSLTRSLEIARHLVLYAPFVFGVEMYMERQTQQLH